MNKTLILGASGQIGKMTTKQLLADGQSVIALVRDKSKLADLASDNLRIVEADLEQDFSQAFNDCDQVIFSAGSGGKTGADKTMLIDLWAACKAIDYAKAANVSHFIMVSSIGADDPDQGSEQMKPYLVAKHMADEYLISSGLNYTIFRPGSLTDDSATGKVQTQRPSSKDKMTIHREDVARALTYAVGKPQLGGKIFELFNGSKSLTDVLN
ncbi:SDR family oxidoreductase [Shewanella livingstonensis]|uniref:SDR family oxidoreductase n=1 Tax=Shewanella livingstonensis TaxID=150120 RepID=A0A3G8M0Z7_9GAMM|nr:SDR family oxidoreductase [Shewanella livingstonensis]AZG75015.1 SDR family oxidoreductase [Shewanella livingstonensis]